MSLRYKGKPDPGFNVQVDKLPPLCFCKFIAIGEVLDASGCEIHKGVVYRCGGLKYHHSYGPHPCDCPNYRPRTVKQFPLHWPRCVCGHAAQEH